MTQRQKKQRLAVWGSLVGKLTWHKAYICQLEAKNKVLAAKNRSDADTLFALQAKLITHETYFSLVRSKLGKHSLFAPAQKDPVLNHWMAAPPAQRLFAPAQKDPVLNLYHDHGDSRWRFAIDKKVALDAIGPERHKLLLPPSALAQNMSIWMHAIDVIKRHLDANPEENMVHCYVLLDNQRLSYSISISAIAELNQYDLVELISHNVETQIIQKVALALKEKYT